MCQKDLFNSLLYGAQGNVPYERGSDTSREAAHAISDESLTRMEQRVYEQFCAFPDGLTDEQVEAATGMRHQSASARRRGLVLKGRLKDSGKRRKNLSGSSAAVWVVV